MYDSIAPQIAHQLHFAIVDAHSCILACGQPITVFAVLKQAFHFGSRLNNQAFGSVHYGHTKADLPMA